MSQGSTTPYAGPTPFGHTQSLFGRNDEIDELQWRLFSERILLLYSPSGAGKTSLLAASNGLLATVSGRFYPTPLLRLNAQFGVTPMAAMLRQLHEATPIAYRTDAEPDKADAALPTRYGEMLEGDTLKTYFLRIPLPEVSPPKRILLVLDQFEELFTSGWPAEQIREFFLQLGALLSNEHIQVWAIFSMREEFYSWVDEFRDLVPTRLTNTFRLNALNAEQAKAAIKFPAMHEGARFLVQDGQDAADHLVRELSTVRIRKADGTMLRQHAGKIEAVQLQVVCVDLWHYLMRRQDPVAEIRIEDVAEFHPDQALLAYCDTSLAAAAPDEKRGVALRNWIDWRLLTPSGMRAPAMIDPANIDNPTPQELNSLADMHLIRQQSREDGVWYELSHDTLASPIRKSIDNWRVKNLPIWRNLARAYQIGGYQPTFFKSLSSQYRQKVRIASRTTEYIEAEPRFFADFGAYENRRRLILLLFLLAFLAILVFIAHSKDLYDMRKATAVQSGVFAILGSEPGVGARARAAVAGTELQRDHPNAVAYNFRTALSDFLYQSRDIEALESEGRNVASVVALKDDYRVVASVADEHFDVRVYGLTGPGPIWTIEPALLKKAHKNGVRSIALVGHGRLATGGGDGTIKIWDLPKRQLLDRTLSAGTERHAPLMRGIVRSIAGVGNRLYAGFEQGIVAAWSLDDEEGADAKPLWTRRMQARVSSLELSDDGKTLVASDISANEHIYVMDTSGGDTRPIELVAEPKEANYRGAFYSVAISPDGRYAAAGSRAGRIHVWDLVKARPKEQAHVLKIEAHDEAVGKLVFTSNGTLYSSGWDGQLKQWTLPEGDLTRPVAGKTIFDMGRQLTGFVIMPDERSAFVTTRKGDSLKLRLVSGNHPLGQIGAGAGTRAMLFTDAGTEKFVSVGNDFVALDVLAHPFATKREGDGLGKPILAAARAPAINSTFIARGEQVYIVRDGDSSALAKPVLSVGGANVDSVFSNDKGTMLVVGTPSRTTLWLYDPQKQVAIRCDAGDIAFPTRPVRLAVFRPGSSDLLTVANGVAQYWRATERGGGCPKLALDKTKFKKTAPEIQAATFDTAGKTLWAGDFTGRLYSIDVADQDGTEKTLLEESVVAPSALAVGTDRDNKTIVAYGDTSGAIFFLQLDWRFPVKIAQNFHDSEISTLALAHGSQWLLSSSAEGTAVWDLRMDQWIGRACKLANNETFGSSDLEKYFSDVPKSDRPKPCATSH